MNASFFAKREVAIVDNIFVKKLEKIFLPEENDNEYFLSTLVYSPFLPFPRNIAAYIVMLLFIGLYA